MRAGSSKIHPQFLSVVYVVSNFLGKTGLSDDPFVKVVDLIRIFFAKPTAAHMFNTMSTVFFFLFMRTAITTRATEALRWKLIAKKRLFNFDNYFQIALNLCHMLTTIRRRTNSLLLQFTAVSKRTQGQWWSIWNGNKEKIIYWPINKYNKMTRLNFCSSKQWVMFNNIR
jgi:hypothetical protein